MEGEKNMDLISLIDNLGLLESCYLGVIDFPMEMNLDFGESLSGLSQCKLALQNSIRSDKKRLERIKQFYEFTLSSFNFNYRFLHTGKFTEKGPCYWQDNILPSDEKLNEFIRKVNSVFLENLDDPYDAFEENTLKGAANKAFRKLFRDIEKPEDVRVISEDFIRYQIINAQQIMLKYYFFLPGFDFDCDEVLDVSGSIAYHMLLDPNKFCISQHYSTEFYSQIFAITRALLNEELPKKIIEEIITKRMEGAAKKLKRIDRLMRRSCVSSW
ncbi:MAG: hypothetical protein LBH37_04885 [Oscillospiraceae bacterium]|jgi:hypothetical protein|nr:hypothetical protein [Oscillospiraceae bacterium]